MRMSHRRPSNLPAKTSTGKKATSIPRKRGRTQPPIDERSANGRSSLSTNEERWLAISTWYEVETAFAEAMLERKGAAQEVFDQ